MDIPDIKCEDWGSDDPKCVDCMIHCASYDGCMGFHVAVSGYNKHDSCNFKMGLFSVTATSYTKEHMKCFKKEVEGKDQ